ncbi:MULTISPECIES: hypothetical protein [Shewanella]|uniref:hypothetical protein n=1 Tax=Shewanella TaxID=22 RepID=UPI00048F9D0E|nr:MULTISPECIES: hypothetical protein [Shewanella]QLE86782.1 hypothetical protein FLM48_17920 [Shewanella sp. Scap07]
MQASALNHTFTDLGDRRITQPNIDEHWHRLTTAQRFAFYTLAKLGYQLLFVRQEKTHSTAVAKQDDQLVTIDDEGDIDFNPTLILRQRRDGRPN